MKEQKYPARLHVLVARDSNKAIVIRRGPSKSTCVIDWDRRKKTFVVSQWLKGRIYERRSDMSPSGEHWIYFAMNGKWDSEAKGAWTAIARSPWLKAKALYAKGDCWNGGGLFLDDRTFWLNDGHGHEQLVSTNRIRQNESYQPPDYYGGECLHVYYNRLQRDGWQLTKRLENGKWDSQTIFEKKISFKWMLRKICHEQVESPEGKGCYWDEHEIINPAGASFARPDWEWAEWLDGAIVFAEQGCLYEMALKGKDGLSKPELLHDFNNYEFESIEAPY